MPVIQGCSFRGICVPRKLRTFDFLCQVAVELRDRHAHLGHRIALAHGNGLIFEGLEVDRDAEGRADLILGVVALADIAALVPGGGELTRNLLEYLARFRDQARVCS